MQILQVAERVARQLVGASHANPSSGTLSKYQFDFFMLSGEVIFGEESDVGSNTHFVWSQTCTGNAHCAQSLSGLVAILLMNVCLCADQNKAKRQAPSMGRR